MKEGETYYLKKHHRPFVTDMPTGTKAVIRTICGNLIHGYYPDDPDEFNKFCCMKHEFPNIFRKTKPNV